MATDGPEEKSEAGRARRTRDGRGIHKLRRWVAGAARIVRRAALMVAASTVEFFSRRRTYRYLAVSFVYLPIGFVALAVVVVLAAQAGYVTTGSDLKYGILLVLVPVFGLGAEYARERFLQGFEVRPRSGWPNRTVVGLEIGIVFLLFTVLAEPIAGDAVGGVSSFLPRRISIPLFPLPGQSLTVTIDELIAAYVFPAAFVLYLYDERLSSLWPPGQFTDVVVDERYVSLAVAWGVIFIALNNGVPLAVNSVLPNGRVIELTTVLVKLLATTWAGATLLYLSLFTVAANAPAVDTLVDASEVTAAATEQSSLDRYLR